MLKEVLELLKSLNSPYRLGVAGSVAKGKENKRSGIDIVVEDRDIDMPIKDIENLLCLEDIIKERFGRKSDILFLSLLKEEHEILNALSLRLGLGSNDDSVYNNILREVVWCE